MKSNTILKAPLNFFWLKGATKVLQYNKEGKIELET